MTTVAKVVVEGSFDPSGVRTGLAASESAIREYVADVKRMSDTIGADNLGKATGGTSRSFGDMSLSITQVRDALERTHGSIAKATKLLQDEAGATDYLTRHMALQEIQAYKLDAAMRKAAWKEYIGGGSSGETVQGPYPVTITGDVTDSAAQQKDLGHIEKAATSTRRAGQSIAHMAEIAMEGTTSLSLMATAAGHAGEEMAHMSGSAALAASAAGIGMLGAALGVLIGAAIEAHKKLNEIPEGKLQEGSARAVEQIKTMEDAVRQLSLAEEMRQNKIEELAKRENERQANAKNAGGLGYLGVGLARAFGSGTDNELAEGVADAGRKLEAIGKRRREIEDQDRKRAIAGIEIQAEAQTTANKRYEAELLVIKAHRDEAVRSGSLTASDADTQAATARREALKKMHDDETRDSDKAWHDHTEALRAVVEAYRELQTESHLTVSVQSTLLSTYASVNAELAHMTDLTSKHAAELLKVRREIEQTTMMTSIMGAGRSVVQTPGGAAALIGNPADAVTQTSALIDRANVLSDAGQRATSEYQRTIAALHIMDGLLTSANEREGITVDRLRAQLALRDRLNQENNIARPHFDDPSITGMVGRAKDAQSAATAARATGAANAPELEAAANAQRERATSIIRNMIEQIGQRNDLDSADIQSLAQLNDLLNSMGAGVEKAASGWAGVAVAMHGVLDAASGLGSIPHALRDGVTAAEHLASSIKAIKAAQASSSANGGGGIFGSLGGMMSAVPGVVGAVGAGLSIISSVTSMFSQHDEALDRNTQKLDELRAAMVDTKGVSGEQQALSVLDAWIKKRGGGAFAFAGSSGNGNQGLDAMVEASGLTLEQFNAIAKSLGIEFSRGLGWLQQFEEALKLSIQQANKFADTLGDQRTLRDLSDKVNNRTSTADKLNEELSLLAEFAPKIRDQIGAIDTATVEGQTALREALKRLVTEIETNSLDPADLGRLANVKDLAGIIDSLAGGLNTLTSSVTAAAASINNVQWYRINEAIYGVGGGPLSSAGGQPATGPRSPSAPADATPWMPSAGNPGVSITLTGDVNITVPDGDPETLRRTFLKAMQARAFTDFGSTVRWPEVQS